MKKLKKRNNKSVSKFQQGGLFFTESTHPERTWVNAVEARKRGIPLTADPRDPNAQWTYSYEILDPTPGTRSNTIDENPVVNPESIYFLYDPNTGKILNQEAGIIDNTQGLVPLDESWVYHPRMGWFQPNLNNGTIEDTDLELTRNFLGNTLGWEQAYKAPPQTVKAMGDETAIAMASNAAGVVGGEVLGAGLNYASKILPFAPRLTTAAGSTAATAFPAYADYNTYVEQINDLDKYMLGLNNFTLTDLNNLKRIYGDDYLNQLFGWLNASNYNVQPVDGNTFDVYKNERDLSLTDPKSWVDAGILKPEDPMALAGWLTNRYMANPKKQKEAAKLKRNGFRRFLDWGIPLTWLGVKAYRINDALHNQKRDRIVRDVINVLRGQGMIINGSSTQPYSVQTNSQGQPQINSTQNSDTTVRDSAATPVADEAPAVTETERIDWNGKLGSTIDSLRQQ